MKTKTIEQVFTEFASLQKQLLFECKKPTITSMETYVVENYWSVTIRKCVVFEGAMESYDSFVWRNYGESHEEEDERENEAALASFKEKFNLK